MKKFQLIISTILVFSLIVFVKSGILGQEFQEIKKQSYQAYLNNSIAAWEAIEKDVKKRYSAHPLNMHQLYQLTWVQYGMLNTCLANQAEEVFEESIDEAKSNADEMLEANEKWAAAHALKASLLSLEMGFSMAKGMLLGPKSASHIEKAIHYNANEPLGWVQKGGSKLHTPKMFGGSTEKAIKAYKEAIRLYEKDSLKSQTNWLYINTLAWLGNAYAMNEDYKNAMQTYQKALRVEPEFGWVKHRLMKKLAQGMQEE